MLAPQDPESLVGNNYTEKLELEQSQFMRLWQAGRNIAHIFSQYETACMNYSRDSHML